ncbi:30S ribosomal protein S12 methylthiotransferase RimO [Cloacibacillus evryensis]|uniref:30S ribosomal protein S12 methylthiotransferase RimO n=1 Tax=Cloacibacillus evryensis TaxID=508460 RepID=UPI000448B150|nr:30S ribosomal protein S12 methylthiotransferase RimO [Cloacibacillus evryensis]EXG78743.1 ribosomal protein S12 methylthiotransferase RimO [Cloacibacillus evryensis DSM 19522]MEA5036579.1 30S ribosomal protein S12 methylthiotransferase RimO [Cloacibacillus evryensis]
MKIYCLTLGCAKNRVDSECLAGALAAAGHELVPSAEDAECALVNTCGFIRPAVEESIAAILDLEELKKDKKLQKIGVVGCLVNRYGEDLPSEVPLVDFWARTEDWKFVLEQLKTPGDDARRRGTLPLSSKYSRYLKISEGCGNCCTYCAIPGIRGPLRSLPVEVIVKEAAQLAEEGARELCVVGQDLTVYGTDTDGRPRLIELLDALESSLPHDLWIRLLYLHPSRVDRALLERVAAGRQVLPYLDIPVQHGDPEILAAMNRGIAPETLRGIFRTAREINPDFALRTTCMVGFPGEKKRHFDNLKNFVSEVRFDRMGAFTFFPEEGTVAAALEEQVPERTKNRRLGELMRLQEEISFGRQRCFIGRELKVLVEKIEREEGYAEGRSFREAPEVDGVIEIRNIREDLKEGDIITLRVAEAMPHDMTGEEI